MTQKQNFKVKQEEILGQILAKFSRTAASGGVYAEVRADFTPPQKQMLLFISDFRLVCYFTNIQEKVI